MMIKISTLLVVLAAPSALAEHGHAGYDYRAPAISYQLPSNLRPNIPQPQYNQVHELQNGFLPSPLYQQYYAGDVYKNQQTQHALHLNNQGYNSAQSTQHALHPNNQGYNSAQSTQHALHPNNQGYNSAQSTQHALHPNNQGYNSAQSTQHALHPNNQGYNSAQSTQHALHPNNQGYNSAQSTQHALHPNNQGYNSAQSIYHNANYNSFTPNYNTGNLIGSQSVQQSLQQIPAQNPSFSNPAPQQPVITKHIYFHLPPPDDTANAEPATRPPPKKTYNIIFIKLPSQKSTNAARLQQLINQQAAAESKTLIYVLVKKPVTTPIQPVTSKPEVFFVKYKEPRKLVQAVNSGVVQAPQGSIGLLPGQINGHGEK